MTDSRSLKIPKPTRYQNAAIDYYTGLTQNDYLHYGYWEPIPASPDDLTLPRLRVAQAAYATKLIDTIPAGVMTILDVGCGIGGNAATMLDRGFTVEGLAPDPIQKEKFLKKTASRAPFHLSRFEDYQTTKTYDLVLFSESSQYVSVNDLVTGTAKLIKSGGYLLLADMMRTDASYTEGIFSNCHAKPEMEAALIKAGFKSIKIIDISAEIAPTIDLTIDVFKTYGLSTVSYISALVEIAVPPIFALGQKLYKKWLEKPIEEGLLARKIYDQHLCYEIQLWQLDRD
jgi:MPBQ/MSBQ methyltransferase